jgi:hypothetical protein
MHYNQPSNKRYQDTFLQIEFPDIFQLLHAHILKINHRKDA